MRKISWISSIMILVATSCSISTTQVIVDNPTNDTLMLVIGKDSIVLNAKQYKFCNFNEGEYEVKYADTSFRLTVSDKTLLLNPTGSAYILEQAIYSGNKTISKEQLRENRIPLDTIHLAGIGLCGNLKRICNVVINDDFDFGIHQEFPKNVKLFYPKIKLLVKISREDDFLNAKMKELQKENMPAYSTIQ